MTQRCDVIDRRRHWSAGPITPMQTAPRGCIDSGLFEFVSVVGTANEWSRELFEVIAKIPRVSDIHAVEQLRIREFVVTAGRFEGVP